jgi:hypothetical protein
MTYAEGRRSAGRREQGQIIVVAALAMIAIIGGVSLVVEGGNAYAHQRVAQNAADAVADTGATVLAERLGGVTRTDPDVASALANMAAADALDSHVGYYTNVRGQLLTPAGITTNGTSAAAKVGDGTIPPLTQGVRVVGSQVFGTTFAGALGITSFTASADATAVAGALTGGLLLPVVFPVSLQNCDGSGDTVNIDDDWRMSNPGDPPDGQEWNVPLCMSGGGSFMILDLDPTKDCYQETVNPTPMQFNDFPVWVNTDTGNDCSKKVAQGISDGSLNGTIVLIPICDNDCSTESGSGGQYHIVRVVAFYLDYISYSSNPNNSACRLTVSPKYGTPIQNLTGGNGSSSCMVGWFVRYVTNGPVGTGTIEHGEAIGIQLIR